MSKDQIRRKFKSEIHANEIVLLAYYITCINIEAVYDDLVKENQYQSFDGMVLTDTFQLYEQDRDMIANLLPDNSERRTNQKKRNITVVIGNPPYSMGQKSENDDAANLSYPNLDQSISESYAASSSATRLAPLYDSYIRAFRWASDRIGDEGIIGFVTNAGWVDGNATDGFRKCLTEEFSQIYLFHLRGNARTSGELRRKEKGNVFGEGTRTPIAITILVKNKNAPEKGKIYFCDIGDYLDKKQKLEKIRNFRSIAGIQNARKFSLLVPDQENDWLNQGEKEFKKFPVIGDKTDLKNGIFRNYGSGVVTSRDAWCYNFSEDKLVKNIRHIINTFNLEIQKVSNSQDLDSIKKSLTKDPRLISWSRALYSRAKSKRKLEFNKENVRCGLYRPFQKTNFYFDEGLNEVQYQNKKFFPDTTTNNKVIVVTGTGAQKFSCLMTDLIPCFDLMNKGQCFPLFVYDNNKGEFGLFEVSDPTKDCVHEQGISQDYIEDLQKQFVDLEIDSKSVFYYIYALFHSEQYLERFGNNLTRELPRIPICKDSKNFIFFSEAGKSLAKLHVGFDDCSKFPVQIKEGDLRLTQIEDPKSFFRIEKMRFVKKGDKSSVIYNKNITIENIPLEAFEYVVNGKPALEWVMERQCVKTDKASGIVNDANDYANETMNNPAYPLELFQRVITVSLETMKIVKSLPKLDID